MVHVRHVPACPIEDIIEASQNENTLKEQKATHQSSTKPAQSRHKAAMKPA
jgi:hypothetical protein